MRFSHLFRAVLATAFAVMASASIYGQYTPGFSRQINGQVRYAESKTPAFEVLVRVEGFSGGLAGQITTDRNGKFSFSGLHAEQYRVTIHSPGYLDVTELVDLMTAPTGIVNVLLVSDGSGRLPMSTTMTGVVDANVPMPAQNEYNKAKALIDSGDASKVAEAMQHFDKAIGLYPGYFAAHLALGLVQMDQKQWPKAEKTLTAAVAARPDASTAYFALGEVYRREKKYDEGEKILLQGLKLNPDSAEGNTTLGELYWDWAPAASTDDIFKARLESSWQADKKALQLKPTYADAHLLAGNLMLKARRAPDAISHYEEYLKLAPNGPYAKDASSMIQKIKQALEQSNKK